MARNKTGIIKRIILLVLPGLYRITVGAYVRLRFSLKTQNVCKLPKKGPFLLLGNHSSNFDGLFLQCLCPRLIRFVVTDAVFKSKLLSRLLYFVGYIPKRKNASDSKTIRQILRTVNEGCVVGIFPEGQRNWDGRTGPINNATFRLIQLLRIPVFIARFKGAYLSEPRWADTKRRGRVEVEVKKLFDADEKLSLNEIETAVNAAIMHDDCEWQLEKRIPYKGKALCKGFERFLFVCPSCGRIGTMDSSGDRIWCLSCGAAYCLDVYGLFHNADGSDAVRTASALNAWQQTSMETYFSFADRGVALLTDENAFLYTAKNQEASYELCSQGPILLKYNSLTIGGKTFRLSRITGISEYFKSHLEFRYGVGEYRVVFENKRVSAYKWSCALTLAKRSAEQLSKGECV